MERAKIKVSGVHAVPVCLKDIPRGIKGATVRFEYEDPLWDGLNKTIVFEGAVTKDVLNAGEVVEIPPEVLAKSGVNLRVGVYGTDADKNIAVPTLWADLGRIRAAADPSGDETTDPSLPVWAQLEARVDALEQSGGAGDGLSAYEVAVKNGFEGTEEAWLESLVGPQGEQGPAGADGEDGKDGVTPNLSIGTVETLDAGSSATASITGTAEKPVLNLGIPKGADGSGENSAGADLSLGMTGAAVGQTVKITAVDADGVPTAWEPVDLPSGEKAWESIGYDFSAEGVVAVKLELPREDITEATLIVKATGTNSSKMSGRIYGDVEAASGNPDNLLSEWGSMYTTERRLNFGYKECGQDKVTGWATAFEGNTIASWRAVRNRPKKYLYFVTTTADSTFAGTATLYYR